MRFAAIGVALVGSISLSACTFLNPGGAAAARWAALERSREAKLAGVTNADRVCKVMPVTGSTMPKKICSTQAEWDVAEKEQRDAAEKFNSELRNNTGNVGDSPG